MLTPETAIGVLVFIGFFFSVVIHECAHGLMAYWCGDPTAMRMGRITLNPISHIDPFMTILLPGMLILSGMPPFGGARPVPFVPQNLRDPRRDTMLIAWAGPMSNIVLAFGFALVINITRLLLLETEQKLFAQLGEVLERIVVLNLFLAMFNCIPVPPLDGSKIVSSVIPPLAPTMMRLEPYGMFIVLALVLFRVTRFVLLPVFLFGSWILDICVFVG